MSIDYIYHIEVLIESGFLENTSGGNVFLTDEMNDLEVILIIKQHSC